MKSTTKKKVNKEQPKKTSTPKEDEAGAHGKPSDFGGLPERNFKKNLGC